MYLVKFSTNSNQDFINQPFNKRDNNKKQKQVISQSAEIESFTFNVLKEFGVVLAEGKVKTNSIKGASKNRLIEFTSGKALFVTSKNEEEIKEIFKNLFDKLLKKSNEDNKERTLSFNYVYKEIGDDIDYKKMTYEDLVEDMDNKNVGYQFIKDNFDLLFERKLIKGPNKNNEMKFQLSNNEEMYKEFAIDLEDILKIENERLFPNKNLYSKTRDKEEEYVYNKMFIFKLDLNNIGSNFMKIKKLGVEEYSNISFEFYKLIRQQNINQVFKSQGLYSKCLFAAGDDIMLFVRVNEISKVVEIITNIVEEINATFKSVEDKIENIECITCAGGLIIVDYRLPIRLYYNEVENILGKAKSDKSNNILYFNDYLYKFEDFIDMYKKVETLLDSSNFEYNDKENDEFIFSAFYTLLNRLNTEKFLSPLNIVGNVISNEKIKFNDVQKNLFLDILSDEDLSADDEIIKRYLINLINVYLSVSYIAEKEDKKDKKDENVKAKITKLLEEKKDENFNLIDNDNFAQTIGFFLELYILVQNEQDDVNSIIDLIFKKDNSTYMKMQGDKSIQEFIKLEKKEKLNLVMSKILKIKNYEKSEDEGGE